VNKIYYEKCSSSKHHPFEKDGSTGGKDDIANRTFYTWNMESLRALVSVGSPFDIFFLTLFPGPLVNSGKKRISEFNIALFCNMFEPSARYAFKYASDSEDFAKDIQLQCLIRTFLDKLYA
jgi:hypothetical protein